MTDNILSLLENAGMMLPKKQRLICRYILDNPFESCALTISELAEANGVGTTTIARLMTSLGFAGYNEFKRALRRSVYMNDKGTFTSYMELQKKMADSEETETDSLIMMIKLWEQMLDEYQRPEFLEKIKAAAQMIMRAEHIYVFGQRINRAAALNFEGVLQRYTPPITQLGAESDFLFDNLARMTTHDLLIVFLTVPHFKKTVEVLRYAHSINVPTLVITTGLGDDDVCQKSTLTIEAGEQATMLTTLPFMAIVGLIKVSVVRYNGAHAKENLNLLSKQLNALDIYADAISVPFTSR